MAREDAANHVFLDLNVERQGHLLSDSRTAPVGITFISAHGFMKGQQCRSLRQRFKIRIWWLRRSDSAMTERTSNSSVSRLELTLSKPQA